jgi:nitric oxide synthase-interacting protein
LLDAKHATTQSTLTYAERAKLKASSGSRRIGGESFKPYDHCHLCLSLLVSPVSCSRGHMYCRECAVADLIQQKAGIETQKREMERWLAKEEGERAAARQAARERVVRDFEKGMGVGWVGAGGGGSAGKAVAGAPAETGRKKGVEELMKEAEDRAMAKIEAEQVEQRKAKLPAFWLPSLAPEGRVGPIKDVKVQALCHFGGEPHPIS